MRQDNNFPPYSTRRQLRRFGLAGMILPLAVSQLYQLPKVELISYGKLKAN
ncbi:hypothetical protein [Chlorogloeopsis sp. ULAP02]|uniref:hypothetical protein n=1 Tax=Chlorogloeopsis sp. ULAP02 TaxID=3107926 RepID=UPI00313717D1